MKILLATGDYILGFPRTVLLTSSFNQVIPAENLVAAFHGSQKTVLAVSRSPGEARVFLEVWLND